MKFVDRFAHRHTQFLVAVILTLELKGAFWLTVVAILLCAILALVIEIYLDLCGSYK